MKNTWKLLPLSFLMLLATSIPVPADPPPPVCQVLCATTHCTSNDDCPGSRCDFACPREGCCVE